MKSKLLKILTSLTYYPRLWLDRLIFLFIKNDYSILDKFQNQDCLIVGNGPSIKRTELDRIQMPSIGMNKINLLFDKTSWRPDVIVCVNGLVIQQNLEFFNATEIPLVLPVKALYLGVKKRPNVILVKISNENRFEDSMHKALGIGSTVTFTCMQVAAFLNVKKVNIVGVDHSFKISKSSSNKEHNIEVHKGDDENHFDPNYFKGKLWGLPDLPGSERAYALARHYFDSKNIPIKDYTIDGKLTIFKKGRIEELYT